MKYYARAKRKTYSPHLIAYAWAGRYCYKKRVLDIGAGEGHGGIILSLFASRLTLMDIEPKNVEVQNNNKYFCTTESVLIDLEKEAMGLGKDVPWR